MANALSNKLLDIASRRLRTDRLGEWRQAFDVSGTGSTFQRAKLIASQGYDRAAPIPAIAPSPERDAFLEEVAAAIKAAAEAVGAQLR